VLGIPAAMGRFFAPGETGVAVLSYSYWQNRCASDATIVGTSFSTETAT
jgi:hypothetical protein